MSRSAIVLSRTRPLGHPLRRGTPLSRYGDLFHRRSFGSFLAAGALQLAAPSAVLVTLLYGIAFAYPNVAAPDRTSYVALALAFLGLSSAIPTLASAFFSGALADRSNRGQWMRTVNLISILAMVGLAADLVYAPGSRVPVPGPAGFYLPLWVLLLYPSWAVVTMTTTFFRPAFNTSVPRVVEPQELGVANGLIYSVAAGASLAATLVVGILLTVAPFAYSLSVAFVLFFATQIALLGVGADLSVVRKTPPRSVLKEANAGFSYLFRHRALLELTIVGLVVNFLSALALVEVALYIQSWLGLSTGFWYGAMIAVLTAGSAVGFLLISRVHFEHRAGRVVILLTFLMGVCLVVFGLVRSIWLALPIIFVYGLMPGMFTTVFLSTIQATVPDEVMGRVFSADEVGSYALVPVGQFSGGLLVLALGVQGTYLAAGGAIVVFAVVLAATFGALRALGYRPPRPAEPDPEAALGG